MKIEIRRGEYYAVSAGGVRGNHGNRGNRGVRGKYTEPDYLISLSRWSKL